MLTDEQLTSVNQGIRLADVARARAVVQLADGLLDADPQKVAGDLLHAAAHLKAAADTLTGN